MEDLRYILKDYKREKKLHQKKMTALEIIIRFIVCVLAAAVILSLHLKCFLLTIVGIAILIFLLVWYNNEEYK